MNPVTRTSPKTPALTTATAWSSALTGVGAIMAIGSHVWSGTMAAFTPHPRRQRMNRPHSTAGVAPWPARIPPGSKSVRPASA